jgi:sensor histidine kinase YesM
MVSGVDLSSEAARLSPGRWAAMGLLVFAVLLAQLVTYRFLSLMLRRLGRLTGAMNRAAEGDLTQEFDDTGSDEIGQLGRDFNFMIERIRDLFQQTVEREVAQKNAQLRALQFQINPHFIYNTVDILRMRLVMDGNVEVADGLAAFGTMMRYNATHGSLKVPLHEEIDYVREYMMIQRLRFEETVQLRIQVPDSVRQRRILKFVLQPLVENAVQHGRRDDDASVLTVTLDGREEAHGIVLHVRDDGVGMTGATLRRVRALLAEGASESGNHEYQEPERKLGLVNIHRRLSLYYGPRAGLRVDSTADAGTTVELHMPVEDAE